MLETFSELKEILLALRTVKAATGLPVSKKARVKAIILASRSSRSGERPPGITSASKPSTDTSAIAAFITAGSVPPVSPAQRARFNAGKSS